MAITRVKVRNFKSFDELDVELRPLNIVVGGNAAGKSNFLEIFRFMRDLTLHGIEDAVSLQGGMEFLANVRLGASDSVSLHVQSSAIALSWTEGVRKVAYFLELGRLSSGSGFKSTNEKVALIGNDGKVGDFLSRTGTSPKEGGEDSNFVELALMSLEFLYSLSSAFSGIKIFDLNSRLSKQAVPVNSRADLDPDGNNLAIVLRGILQDEDRRRSFVRLVREALPFVEDLKVERFADKSLLIALKEGFLGQTYLPAAFLSDGTIHLIGLIVALYFDKSEVTIIEEPERNIHPHLISKVAAMLKDASRHKQVIVTTHNPELVKHADLDDLLLVQRDERGFSRITRPAENEQLKVFLENDLGVDELYVQNLLGVGHGV